MQETVDFQQTNRFFTRLITFLGFLFFVVAFFYATPLQIWQGFLTILISPSHLITDYFALVGIGPTLVSVSIQIFMMLVLIKRLKVDFSGALIGAVFMVTGFSFFGKNLFNSLPLICGVFLYAKITQTPARMVTLSALFCTGIAPLVSYIAFGMQLPLYISVPLSYLVGLIVGLIIQPFATHCLSFHQGFNLYNTGFTLGIIGLVIASLLRMFGSDIKSISIVNKTTDTVILVLLAGLFLFLIGSGLYFMQRNNQKDYGEMLKQSGRLITDYISRCGLGLTLLNMGIMGILSTTFMLVLGVPLNGPIIGGILSIVGFSAYGKHPRNTIPVWAGLLLAAVLHHENLSTASISLALLFGSALAPISGYFGMFAGLISGYIHMAVVFNTGYIHGGLNLYNNGFSTGFVAALLVPIFTLVRELKLKHSKKEEKE